MSAAPLWVPEHLFDEVTPPPKPTPTDWIIGLAPASTVYMIAGCGEYEQECETATTLAVGATMDFMPFRDFGTIVVEVRPDGDGIVLDPIPAGASSFCDPDGECFGGDVGEVVAQFCEANGKPDETVTLRVSAYDWGTAQPFRLTISAETGKAEFVAVVPEVVAA